MTVQELIRHLNRVVQDNGGDLEVRFSTTFFTDATPAVGIDDVGDGDFRHCLIYGKDDERMSR